MCNNLAIVPEYYYSPIGDDGKRKDFLERKEL